MKVWSDRNCPVVCICVEPIQAEGGDMYMEWWFNNCIIDMLYAMQVIVMPVRISSSNSRGLQNKFVGFHPVVSSSV